MPTNERLGTCEVEIGGKTYDRFVSVTFKRSFEELTGSGTIVLSWPGAEAFDARDLVAPEFKDGARGTLKLDGQKVCTFRIDVRNSHGTPNQYLLTLTFRGISGAIVDGQPNHETGQFNNQTPGQIAQKLADKYESKIIDQSEEKKEIERFIVAEGEPAERAIRRALREKGLNIVENVDGDLEIKKKNANEGSGQALEIGKNFYEWSTQRDMSVRFSDYCILGNGVVTDKKRGKDNEELQGCAKDPSVQYHRFMRTQVHADNDKESIGKRAIQEARRRSASGIHVTLKLSTWSDDGGKLWAILKDHHVKIPVDTIDCPLRVSALVFTMTATERSTSMTLISTDAFNDGKGSDIGGGGKVLNPDITTPAPEPPKPTGPTAVA